MFLTLPTLLTWARIVAIPLIVGLFYLPAEPVTRNLAATVLFVVVALTDWLDGYLARKLNQTSSFGAFLDPVADKFLVCASLLVLVDLSDPAWPEQLHTVHAILDGLGARAPRRLVANQIDRCPAGELERARALAPDALFVSATAGLGLQHLRQELRHWPGPPESEANPHP